MKRFTLLLLLITCAYFASGFSWSNEYKTHSYIIQLEDNSRLPWITISSNDDFKIIEEKLIYPDLNIHKLLIKTKLEENQTKQILERLQGVMHVCQNLILEDRATVPNDPFIGTQIHHDYVNTKAAWDITTDAITKDNNEAIIAIFETGFSTTHEDLKNSIFRNTGEIPNDGIDNDQNGWIDDYEGYNVVTMNDQHPSASHGSSVHGIIGAKGNNDIGVSGMLWESSNLLISNVTDIARILEAMSYVKKMREDFNNSGGEKGAFIVATNLSKGASGAFPESQPIWCSAYSDLGSVGILNIVASPNSNTDIDAEGDLPSLCPSEHIISVTRTTYEDVLQNAGYGSTSVDLSALGFDVHTTGLNNGYDSSFKGTSAATPQVTGAIGLIYGTMCQGLLNEIYANPESGSLIVKSILLDNVSAISSLAAKTTTGGKLNTFEAVKAARDYCGITYGEFEIINIYPNPGSELIRLQYQTKDENPIALKIFDPAGKLVWSQSIIPPAIFEKFHIIDYMDKFPTSIYYVQLESGGEKIISSFMKL